MNGQNLCAGRNSLTPRETDITKRVACGLRSDQIARLECVSERTVRSHLQRIYDKLGIVGRTQLAVWALVSGVIEPAEVIAAWREHLPEVLGAD
jgi:DNA-binding CsgD family transcriptional regulator